MRYNEVAKEKKEFEIQTFVKEKELGNIADDKTVNVIPDNTGEFPSSPYFYTVL